MATDHFVRNNWQEGRTDWNFNILFNDQPQIAEFAEQFEPLLQHPGLHKPVPGEWLHATVLKVGFLEEFTDDEMLQVAENLESQLASAQLPEFLLGNWWVWGGNPCLHITPDAPLYGVFKLLRKELEIVVGAERLPILKGFTPHITLAYSKTYDDEKGLLRQMEAKQINAVPLRANNLSLIKQCVIDDYFAWDVVKDIPIGQA